MRIILWVWALLSFSVFGQQAPFVQITDPPAPKGAAFLFPDSRGRLWLGGMEPGSEGLTYFDGSRFVQAVDDFPKVLVTGMAEDTEGGIWVTSNFGIYRVFLGHVKKIVGGSAPWGITPVARDVFLASVAPAGTYEHAGYSPKDSSSLVRIVHTPTGWRADALVKEFSAARFWADSAGEVFYHCLGGYCEVRGQDLVDWRPGMALPSKQHAFPMAGDSTVLRDRSGCFWMRGFYETSYECPGDSLPTKLPSGFPRGALAIGMMPDGTMVLSGNSLALGRPGSWRVLTTANGYPLAASSAVGRDGSVWMSNSTGLFVLPSHVKIELWTEREGVDGLAYSVLRMGNKVFAAVGDAVRVLDTDRSAWRSLTRFPFAAHLTEGPNHTILANSRSNGIEQIGLNGELLGKSSQPLTTYTTARAKDGKIWSTGDEISVLKFGRRLALEPIREASSWRDTLDTKVDQIGDVWACSGAGLIHKDRQGWHLISTSDGLLENRCRSLTVDSAGDVWYAYESAPAFSWIHDAGGKKPQVVNFSDGGDAGTAASNFLHFDRRGWLWRGTQDGLYIADLEQARQGRWLYLNRKDGFAAVDTNQRAFFEDSDGSVWFGMSTTIVHLLPPDDLAHPNYAPSVFLSGFSWKSTFHTADTGDSIEHGENLIANIGSLQFDRRNALRIRYRLLPDQANWRESKTLDLLLGALPSGEHTLEVQGRVFTGPWSQTARQSFSVLRPAWLAGPFITSYFLGAFVLSSAGYWLYRKQRSENAQLLPDLASWRLGALVPEVSQFTGAVLDSRFKVGKLLARGGFANVLEGHDEVRKQRCAIKIFRTELKNKAWIQQSFDQEVAALQKIRHPNVVSINAFWLHRIGRSIFSHGICGRPHAARDP